MKIEFVLLYALQAILFAECRLRHGGSKSQEMLMADEASSEPDTDNSRDHDRDHGKDSHRGINKQKHKQRMELEWAAGSVADALAPNQHYAMTDLFNNLGRRFVPQYPYYEKEKQKMEDKKAEADLHKLIQGGQLAYKKEDQKLLPIRASPEFVLSVARQSKALEDARPVNPADKLITKQILRSGDYWNGVWKEDVDPKILRTAYEKPPKTKIAPLPKLGTVRTKIMPGTKLYQLISVLKQISPKFLYVMNVD